MSTEPKRPRGPGKHNLGAEQQTVVGSIRLTPADWELLRELRVSQWLVPALERERKRREREAQRA